MISWFYLVLKTKNMENVHQEEKYVFSVKYLINMMVLNRGSMILISRGLCNGSYFKLVLFFFKQIG